MITEIQLAALTEQHQQWLRESMTKQIIQVLNEQERMICVALAANAGLGIEQQEKNAVNLSVQLNTVQTITKLITNTPIFVKNLTKKQQ